MSRLHSTYRLRCGLEIRGRVALAPMTNLQSHEDGRLSQDEYRWLVRRAEGGFPLVLTCATYVHRDGQAWSGQLGAADDAHEEGLRRLAAGLKGAGAAAFVQLHHGGAKAEVAAERISTGGPAGARAASLDDIERLRGDFVSAALRCERAGFDGVELHGANGYLFTQFLAPADNPRADAYGGDLAGRARFLRETVQAVRAAVSPGFAVAVRISPVDVWSTRGLKLADSLRVGQWLAQDGVDLLHLSLSDATGPGPHEPDAESVVTAFRRELPEEIALMTVGGIWTRTDAIEAMAAGADMVALGKVAIGNPEWPRRVKDAQWAPQRPTWSREHLRAMEVSETFITYLSRFPGLVEGGRAARGS